MRDARIDRGRVGDLVDAKINETRLGNDETHFKTRTFGGLGDESSSGGCERCKSNEVVTRTDPYSVISRGAGTAN